MIRKRLGEQIITRRSPFDSAASAWEQWGESGRIRRAAIGNTCDVSEQHQAPASNITMYEVQVHEDSARLLCLWHLLTPMDLRET